VSESTKRSGFDVRFAVIVLIGLLLVLAGAGFWAYTTNNDLQTTRAALASTSGELDTTKTNLASITSDLDTASTDLATAQDAIKADKAKITVLNFQIERKGACIQAQTANLTEMRRILALERANFARTTSGSAWDKAHAAAQKAINAAIDYLYKAYTSAAARKYSTANANIDRSNAQIRASNKQLDALDKEIDAINKSSDDINMANDAFSSTLDTTSSTCGS
jgi:septal ring factor EnvC (AmiA/AmiB activator)